jgi:hypothetical protein
MRGLMLSLGLALSVGVGGEQEKDVLVEASPLGRGLCLQVFTLLVGIETEDYRLCHGAKVVLK